MQDFQKSLLLLCNNLKAQLKTPFGRSLMLHFIVILLLIINFDFISNKQHLEVIPVESLTVSVINDETPKIQKPVIEKEISHDIKPQRNITTENKSDNQLDNKLVNSKFDNIFSKLKNKDAQQKKAKKTNQDFDNLFKHKLLKNLENKKSKNNKEEVASQKQDVSSNESNLVLSTQEEDEIRRQIIPNWLIPAGVKNAEDLIVEVLIEIAPDGTITKTKILNPSNETNFKIASQSAIRALLLLSSIKISLTLKS